MNSSFGVGHELAQSGDNGPSIFPRTALAIRLRVEPTERFYLQTAAFNGLAGDTTHARGAHFRFGRPEDGLLLVTEAGLLGTEKCPAKYAIGQWSYTKAFDDLSGTEKTTESGTYFLIDQSLHEKVTGFIRYGMAESKATEAYDNLSLGFNFTGIIPHRDDDQFGIGMTKIRPSQKHVDINGPLESHETTFEATYRFQVWKGVVIQPDYQLVQNPDFSKTVKDAEVGSLRLEVSF